jgi:MFS family permease
MAGLAVLFVVYTLNFLDRSLVYILFGPIGKELELTDLQLALLGSTSFVLFYTVLGIPFGRLADRVHRLRMIAAGLALWSLASSLTGLVSSFEGLLLCRIGVGVGEATLGPAAYSLLADWFPPRRRATAAALFAAGIPLGAGLALGLGGYIGQHWGWRAAFPALGLPGLLVALVVLALREPTRGAIDKRTAEGSLGTLLRSSKTLRYHLLGYAACAVGANALTMWVPRYLSQHWGRSLAEVGLSVGMCAVVGGLCGTSLGGVLADALQRRHAGGRLAFGALTAAGSALCWLLLLGTEDYTVALFATGVGMALGLAWLGPASADIQDLVPAEQRGLAISTYYLVVNVVGYGLAPPVLGALADALGGPETMGTALLLCPLASLLAAALLTLGSRSRAGLPTLAASS